LETEIRNVNQWDEEILDVEENMQETNERV
jgi:hypothetical protein